MSGKTPQIRARHTRQPGGEKALGTEPVEWPHGQARSGFAPTTISGAAKRPSFVTTDHNKYAGYHTLAERTMSPETPVMSQKARQSPPMENRKIFGDTAVHRAVE